MSTEKGKRKGVKGRHHPDFLYIGSTVNLRHRWTNHKYDCKLRKGHKCHVAQHFLDKQHPVDPQFICLRIFTIEAVHKKENLVKLFDVYFVIAGRVVSSVVCWCVQLTALCQEAGIQAMTENVKAREVHQRHFDAALRTVWPRTTQDTIHFYEKYTAHRAV
ncbi:hypothetical protein ACOMHN_035883 [Nucella lapillus]